MRVAVYPDDEGGCGSYRLSWPGRQLKAAGFDVTVHPVNSLQGEFADPLGTEIPELVDIVSPDADVVVLQRVLQRVVCDAIPMLQAKGLKVVVDIDDDFAAIHPRNVSFPSVHPKTSPRKNWGILMEACSLADWVTVTTPALARRYGKHGRVSVVPNRVPGWYLDIPKTLPRLDAPVIGWSGTVQTHPTDLQATGGAVATICKEGAVVGAIGSGIGVGRGLGLPSQNVPGTGWLELSDYPKAMAQVDIGIVPLDDIAFNHGKSALKVMEFAACGVPVIASPTPDNSRMAKHGVCVLAGKRREWERELRRLLDPGVRAELAATSREAMRGHTIANNLDSWWDGWTAPLQARRSA